MFTCENIRKNATGKQEQGEKEGGKQTGDIKESDKADIKKLNENGGLKGIQKDKSTKVPLKQKYRLL